MRSKLLIALLTLPALAAASNGHDAPELGLALSLAVLLLLAKVGGELAVRLDQPAVLGELLMGILLGNLALPLFDQMRHDANLDMLARLGVLVLLFEVGLESTVGQFLKVGWASLKVAVLGVLAPFALGWGVGALLLPEASVFVHVFLGAALCATSVGITARVLGDLKASKTDESRIILGAAVIDDVLGLLVLAVVSGIIAAAGDGSSLAVTDFLPLVVKALAFLVISMALGVRLAPGVFAEAAKLKVPGVQLALGLVFCFGMSWAAGAIGLAPMVGAFTAGLILEEAHYERFVAKGDAHLHRYIHPISAFLVPIFFMMMGLHTDLSALAQPGIFGLALALTLVAVLGKLVAGLGAPQGSDRLSIGLGMVPRGEVGLIFANVGLGLSLGGAPIISPQLYAAIVTMVVLTTMATPPALRWSLRRPGGAAHK
jgi:Kef-type K+ transport system membrane component KefB